MKAVLLKKTGGPGILKIVDVPAPVPGKGELLVRLHYTGINYAEILSRKGLYSWAVKRPYILGMEGSGIIESVGEGVDKTRIGEAVMVGSQYGCYAEKVAVPQTQAIIAIKGFSMAENAAFLVNYLTAWVSLFSMAKLMPGEKVLITAAAGGVGTAAIQLACRLGCQVYGLAGSQEKIDFLKDLGAVDALNYRDDRWLQKLTSLTGGVDVVLEMVGGKIYKNCFGLLNPFGRLVVAGFASLNLKKWNPVSWLQTWRDMPRVPLMKMAEKSVSVMSTHLGYLLKEPQTIENIFSDLKTFVQKHNIKPVIGQTLPFDQIAKAHALIESRKTIGKVVMKHGNLPLN